MEKPEIPKFPPRLIVGNRVWTTTGYCNHGPESGPKVDIAPNRAAQSQHHKRIATRESLATSCIRYGGTTVRSQNTTPESFSVLAGSSVEQNLTKQSNLSEL